MRRKQIAILVAVLVLVVSCNAQKKQAGTLEKSSSRPTWQQVMIAARVELGESTAEQNKTLEAVEPGPWYMAGPIKGGKFTDKSFAERPVDLSAVDSGGKALWQKRDDMRDGEIFRVEIETGRVEPVYLYRQIKAGRALRLIASFAGKNTLEVWLNGKNILTSLKEGGIGKDQHIVELNLNSGVNELLVRIFNWRRRGEVYFSLDVNPALILWRRVAGDYPVQSGWMQKDLGLEGCLGWFEKRDKSELEEKMIKTVLKQTEPAGKTLGQELGRLSDAPTGPGDMKWLDLYVRACRLRHKLGQLDAERAKIPILRAAAERLTEADARQKLWAYVYTNKLKLFENTVEQARLSLEADDRYDLGAVDEASRKLGRELIVRGPGISAGRAAFVLDGDKFRSYVDGFNGANAETIVNFIPNALSWDWMKVNVPLFECPDEDFERIYYYRWWTYRKHIKNTPDGYVLTEFLAPVGHSGKYNTISCALGHHIMEGRWLHNRQYMDDYIRFWYRSDKGKPVGHYHRYSNWAPYAVYQRYLVNSDGKLVTGLLDDFIHDFKAWQNERGTWDGMFWQYDVLDGGEESISGSRHKKNVRPPLNSYMYGTLWTIAQIAKTAGRDNVAAQHWEKATKLKSLVQEQLWVKSLVQEQLWDSNAKFFKARLEAGGLCDAREAIGFIPWYFNLPDAGYEQAWLQIREPAGFKAPMGLTTAERRHPAFRANGVGTCEWDGAVWPFASTLTLGALANVLRDYPQEHVSKRDYFDALITYARSHDRDGKPYIGEYLDEVTGQWLTPDSDRSRFYNHSAFCDLVIAGLVGLVPREDDVIEVDPLLPADAWDWFCLDNVLYHGRIITILWDKTGSKYSRGKGLRVYVDGKEVAYADGLERVRGKLP
jgi:hypothetical protein